MTPRRSAADAERTRFRIIDRATTVASAEGFDSMTLGRVAGDVGMSKAGVIAHFGTMESLQLAAVEQAVAVFRREVWDPVAHRPPGRERLEAVCDAWLDYVVGSRYVGGCFTAAELSASPRVRAAAAAALVTWRRVLCEEVRQAGGGGAADPETVVFELSSLVLGATQAMRLDLDDQAVDRARRSMRRALGP